MSPVSSCASSRRRSCSAIAPALGVEVCGHRPSLPAAMISSEAGWWLAPFRADALPDLLQGPVVAVRVGEEDELPAVAGVQRLDRRDLDATPGQLGEGRVD